MRLAAWTVAALLAAASAPARAGTPASAPRAPQAQLVRVLGGGQQALVLDRNQGAYVVVRVGDTVQGLRVAEISSYQIVLVHADGRRHYVLPLVPPTSNTALSPGASGAASASGQAGGLAAPPLDPYAGAPDRAAAAPPIDPYAGSADSRAGDSAPLDPYAATERRDAAGAPPLDPYGSGGLNRAPAAPGTADPLDPYGGASAPRDPYARPIPSVKAPPGSRVPRSAPSAPSAAPARPRPAPAAPSAAPAPRPRASSLEPPVIRGAARRDAATERRTLSRRELDAALADFDALGKEMQIRIEPGRGARLVDLSRGSLAHRLGLRAGDLVVTIAGRRVTSADDAAAAYVALDRADSFAIVVERGGRRHTLQVALTP